LRRFATATNACAARAADHSVFVGDLAPEVNDFTLQEHFRQHFASVRSAKVWCCACVSCPAATIENTWLWPGVLTAEFTARVAVLSGVRRRACVSAQCLLLAVPMPLPITERRHRAAAQFAGRSSLEEGARRVARLRAGDHGPRHRAQQGLRLCALRERGRARPLAERDDGPLHRQPPHPRLARDREEEPGRPAGRQRGRGQRRAAPLRLRPHQHDALHRRAVGGRERGRPAHAVRALWRDRVHQDPAGQGLRLCAVCAARRGRGGHGVHAGAPAARAWRAVRVHLCCGMRAALVYVAT